MSDERTGDLATEPFASASLAEHLLRGLVGFAAVALAIWIAVAAADWWRLPLALVLAGIAIVSFRGCPTCWIVGLFATCRNGCRR